MNAHPIETGEYLAEHCLQQARGDYAVAADLLLAEPHSERREHAIAALTLWAAFDPPAYDNVVYPGIWDHRLKIQPMKRRSFRPWAHGPGLAGFYREITGKMTNFARPKKGVFGSRKKVGRGVLSGPKKGALRRA